MEANKQITVALAPSKEDLSLRAYTARRKLNRLRRSACLLFQSEPIVRVIQKVEYEVERGGLKIRTDRKIHADYGKRIKIIFGCLEALTGVAFTAGCHTQKVPSQILLIS